MEETEPLPPPADKKPKSPKKPIKSTVNVHDRTQIETVFDYYLNRLPKGARRSDELSYKVEAFLFYPRQFGIDPATYPKERFYGDMRPLLRFREPRLSFKQMLGLKEKKVRSPLLWLAEYVEVLHAGRMLEPMRLAVDETRIFACSFISTFLKGIDRFRKRFTALSENPDAVTPAGLASLFERTVRLLDKADALLVEYRKVLESAQRLPDGVGEELKTELRLIDEYCYYRLRDGVAYLLGISEDLRKAAEATSTTLMQRVLEVLAAHDAHAARQGYIVLTPTSPPSVRERFLHRRGELKRRIWAVLFLEIRTEPLFAIQRQTGAMIAAGLAAAWAVVAQVIVFRAVMLKQDSIDILGFSGLLFISAAVFAYVIKDRIKEIGRSYFRSGLFRKIPDHSEQIFYRQAGGERVAIGRIRETAKYERLDALPPEVAAIRRRIACDKTIEEQTVDGVLRYTKVITLSRKIKILGRYTLRAVHDILRLNIDACLPRLGEPMSYLDVVDDKGELHALAFPKVYYFDIALTYSLLGDAGETCERSTDYFRLVVDKTGLMRIERLA